MSDGVTLIAAERQRQIDAEGWTSEHDDGHTDGELSRAAAFYAIPPEMRHGGCTVNGELLWPWENEWCRPTSDRAHELAKAGALIAAELDRLQRADTS